MAFKLNQDVPADEEGVSSQTAAREEGSFSISAQPVATESTRGEVADERSELPLSYRTQTLWLMPRDPQSLFAFWDVDWHSAFHDETPSERKVHLRLFSADGSEETAVEIEPMAGNCCIPLTDAEESYSAEIGFYEPADTWHLVARSTAVEMPSSGVNRTDDGDFATIPLHLSFQRMIDAFRSTHHESASLTQMLSDLRERVASADHTSSISSEEREIARALDHATANGPQSQARQPAMPDLWARMEADRVLGFGATSPRGGFGGNSSRA